ncbi:helix-turn-helix domain-containing protein [Alicyclobacillus fastidiosus]|uniref:Helix-turn-helix transcriptional regulator n=1 Tax=Alicyclobacillus fastidiosus TaxID=392011 RepID=A0ABV5AIG9_9BACL|nr:helix-turn-helix transcriptional regulator [Alicyclobacillus fastidiosus]WEH11136.1 helix-turn-helix transcriptional regulator [Alicyclobacillus fastidiosus]
MIRVKLSELLGKRRKKVTELAEATGIHHNTLYRLYHEDSTRVDLAVLEKLCEYFNCRIEDLLEYDKDYVREIKKKNKSE